MSFTNEIEYFVYDEYIELGKEAYLEKILYYESQEQRILNLPFFQSLEIQCDYIEALHQTDKHYKLLEIIDGVIATVMYENIYTINGTDVYKSLLYIKADALYNTLNYRSSNHVVSELIKIEGDNILCKSLFIKNSIDNLRYEGQKIRAIGILLFLCSAMVIGVEILMIKSFYNEWINIFVAIRNILFLGGILSIVGQEIDIRIKSFEAYHQLLK